MGYRFSRRIKIAPGLKLNLSGSGLSVTAGIKGASVTYGKKGTHVNLSLAGTGLGYRARLGGSSSDSNARNQNTSDINFTICEDGDINITDREGCLVDVNIASKVKKDYRSIIEDALIKDCEARNRRLKSVCEIHISTLAPDCGLTYTAKVFDDVRPILPLIKKYGLLGTVFKGIREKIDLFNKNMRIEYETLLKEWNLRKKDHDLIENALERVYSLERFQNAEGMMKCLDHRLSQVDWPLETEMTYEVSEDLNTVWMDVDLPEVESMPSQVATVSKRSLKLSLKKLSESEIRKSYMVHTHGILYRLIGEVFASLPMVERVIISGYSQRLNKSTMHINNEYLLSVDMSRSDWIKTDFDNLASLNVINAFENCSFLRDMSKTGIFKPILPFDKMLK